MTKADQFKQLADQVGPLQGAMAPLQMQMIQLSAEMGLEIVQAAFPEAQVLRVKAFSEIKPSDYARQAQEIVRALQEKERRPSLVILDETRSIILLADGKLPPAAKSQAKKRRK